MGGGELQVLLLYHIDLFYLLLYSYQCVFLMVLICHQDFQLFLWMEIVSVRYHCHSVAKV